MEKEWEHNIYSQWCRPSLARLVRPPGGEHTRPGSSPWCCRKKIPSPVLCPKHVYDPAYSQSDGPRVQVGAGVREFSRPVWESLLLNTMPWGRSFSPQVEFFLYSQWSKYYLALCSVLRTQIFPSCFAGRHFNVYISTIFASTPETSDPVDPNWRACPFSGYSKDMIPQVSVIP